MNKLPNTYLERIWKFFLDAKYFFGRWLDVTNPN